MVKKIQTEADEFGFFGAYGGQYVPVHIDHHMLQKIQIHLLLFVFF